MKVEVQNGYCATYSKQEDQYHGGLCPFGHPTNSTDRNYAEMPTDPDMFNDAMCGPYNRKGLLCGECIDGYGPAVFSYDLKCANCSKLSLGYAISLFLFLELVPGTLFFICLVIFRLNITTGPLLGYVLLCQIYAYTLQEETFIYNYMVSDVADPLRVLLYVSLTLAEFWNLHFFKPVIPPFCISNKLTGVHIQMLSLVTTMYPISLVFVSFILMELHARKVPVAAFECQKETGHHSIC